MSWTHRCLIVPAAHVKFARQLPRAIAGPSGAGMWTTPLSPTGSKPATHFISAGLIDEQFAALMPLTQYPADEEPIHTPGRAAIAAHLATQNGYVVTTEEVQAHDYAAAVAQVRALMFIERFAADVNDRLDRRMA